LIQPQLELKVPVDTKEMHWLKVGTDVEVVTEDDTQIWVGKIARIGDSQSSNTVLDVYVVHQNEN
jgi:hypothetical protein